MYTTTFLSVDTALEIAVTLKQFSTTAETISRFKINFSFKPPVLIPKSVNITTDTVTSDLYLYVYCEVKDSMCSEAGTFQKICR